jgi:arylformamidase
MMTPTAGGGGASIWRGMNRAALDAAYDNRAAVADSADWIARWTARTRELRALHPDHLDLAYGERPRNRIDLYRSGAPGAALLAFIHGGYWQRNSKDVFGCLGEGLLAHGIDVAMVGYTLCPEIRLSAIVAEIEQALDWLVESAPQRGFPARRIVVSGWSAGGHLTALAMHHAAVTAGLAISGIFDLEPIRLGSLNDAVGLDASEVERLSPIRRLPPTAGPLTVAFGEEELPELQRQSREFFARWQGMGLPGQLLGLPGRNHFSVLDALHRPDGALTAAVRRLID